MNDPGGPGAIGGMLAGIAALLGLAGGLVAWLFGRRDRSEETRSAKLAASEETRTAKLSAWHAELLAREQLFTARSAEFQARMERHLAEQDEKIDTLEGEVEKYRVATAALIARVAQYDPADPVLTQVAKLLGTAFPLLAAESDGAMGDLLKRMK